MSEQPTKEQTKEFWIGYEYKGKLAGIGDTGEREGKLVYISPPIDLNNLFEWAVPIAVKKIMLELGTDYDDALHSLLHDWMVLMRGKKDPALALFWTLDKVRENKK